MDTRRVVMSKDQPQHISRWTWEKVNGDILDSYLAGLGN